MRRPSSPVRSLLSLAALIGCAFGQPAADAEPARITPMTPDVVGSYQAERPEADYIRRVSMIPMRDGVKLYTVIVMRKGVHDAPMLLSRTPYDAKESTSRLRSQSIDDILPAMDAPFVDDGYIRIYQDIRGLHNSEGAFVMNRPIVGPLNDTGIDESTDAYDTIDWLVRNVPESNRRVAVIGSSYLGFTTLAAEINPHPALKAAVPQSPMVDGWMGDDWFHNGAFRNPTFSYLVEQSTAKGEGHNVPAVGIGDDYTRFLEAGSSGDFARHWGLDQFPFAQKLMRNPAYTAFWSLQAVDKWLAARPLTVPTLLMVGQWDQEDSYGAPAVYQALRDKDPDGRLLGLIIGPWRHSGANHYGYDLGALTFTGDTAEEARIKYLKPFLDHHLKDAPRPQTAPVLTYATGVNRWEGSPRWPMGEPVSLYLGQGHGAAFTAPSQEGHDDYLSDPAKPVPFLPRPISMDDPLQWKPWLVHDQRFVSDRPDVLVYQTVSLDQPVHIMGAPQVDLFAATSGTDSDWVVKLIDVFPATAPERADQGARPAMAGFELPIGIEIFRGRYVHGFDQPQALEPGRVEEYRFGLPNVDHVFLPGHRIMVQVQSSLFPLYDRNPQTFVANIFDAAPGDYRRAMQSVHWGASHPSRIVLPVVR